MKNKNPLFSNPKNAQSELNGPSIWVAGDPEDLEIWLNRGAVGIVTNTIVLNDMTKKHTHTHTHLSNKMQNLNKMLILLAVFDVIILQ